MKKLFILALLFAIAGIAFSQVNRGQLASLYLSLNDGSRFNVVLDNDTYRQYTDEFKIDKIDGGKHYLKILSENGPSRNNIIFEDYVFIPGSYCVYAVIDEFSKFYIYKKLNYNDRRISGTTCTCTCQCCQTCPICNPNGNRHIENQQDDCALKVISPADFAILKNLVNGRTFETNKIEFLKSGIEEHFFLTFQVKEMLALLTFEYDKLEMAKYAYKKTCDNGNYYTLFDAFTFESSVMDLKDWIKENRQK